MVNRDWSIVMGLGEHVMAFTGPGESVAVEDSKFNKGGGLHFRFSGFQDKLRHRCALTGHDFVRVQAVGTSSLARIVRGHSGIVRNIMTRTVLIARNRGIVILQRPCL